MILYKRAQSRLRWWSMVVGLLTVVGLLFVNLVVVAELLVVVVELLVVHEHHDLHLAVDFLELFLSTAHLLEDPSIFCISGNLMIFIKIF